MIWFKNKFSSAFFFFVFSIFTIYVSIALVVANKAEKDTSINSDAILVLGARSYVDNKINPCLKSRIDHAVDLYNSKKASKIIFSGGVDREDGVNEAEIMKQIAVQMGVNPEDVLLERLATSTYENFLLSNKIIKENNFTRVIIVTEPFHIARSSLVADKLGIQYNVSPVTNSPCWSKYKYLSKYFLKEPIAILGYKLQNKI